MKSSHGDLEKNENSYFDFYPENAFISKIRYIVDFYESREKDLDREFVYLTESEMNGFAEEACERIMENLVEIGAAV